MICENREQLIIILRSAEGSSSHIKIIVTSIFNKYGSVEISLHRDEVLNEEETMSSGIMHYKLGPIKVLGFPPPRVNRVIEL